MCFSRIINYFYPVRYHQLHENTFTSCPEAREEMIAQNRTICCAVSAFEGGMLGILDGVIIGGAAGTAFAQYEISKYPDPSNGAAKALLVSAYIAGGMAVGGFAGIVGGAINGWHSAELEIKRVEGREDNQNDGEVADVSEFDAVGCSSAANGPVIPDRSTKQKID